MNIPAPSDELAGCVWLPRILFKARALKQGTLPAGYAERFCHPTGLDAVFLANFGLTRTDIETAADLPDAEVATWFKSRLGPNAAELIQSWNHIATNLGRPGFPLANRLPERLATTYKHVASPNITSIFEMLEADDHYQPE